MILDFQIHPTDCALLAQGSLLKASWQLSWWKKHGFQCILFWNRWLLATEAELEIDKILINLESQQPFVPANNIMKTVCQSDQSPDMAMCRRGLSDASLCVEPALLPLFPLHFHRPVMSPQNLSRHPCPSKFSQDKCYSNRAWAQQQELARLQEMARRQGQTWVKREGLIADKRQLRKERELLTAEQNHLLDNRSTLGSNEIAHLLTKSKRGRNENGPEQSKRNVCSATRASSTRVCSPAGNVSRTGACLTEGNDSATTAKNGAAIRSGSRTGPTTRTRSTGDRLTTRACSSWNSAGGVGSSARGEGKSQQLDETRKIQAREGVDDRVGTHQTRRMVQMGLYGNAGWDWRRFCRKGERESRTGESQDREEGVWSYAFR